MASIVLSVPNRPISVRPGDHADVVAVIETGHYAIYLRQADVDTLLAALTAVSP